MFKVVCGFNGTVYSRHATITSAESAARGIRRRLSNKLTCGALASYVEVVPEEARFTRIVPCDNAFGCCSVDQPRWVY